MARVGLTTERATIAAAEPTYGVLRGCGPAEPDLTDAVRPLRSTCHGFVAPGASGGFAYERSPERSRVRALDALHIPPEHWPPSRDGEPA
ncbi:TetR-like C-terminal domain-containing protein [Kitasatospora sp. NPDC001540]|uniref:TetR-like C-terminal domain-containing protein n=1 Tax=Kitasatospora sp. NPDC001540 TaxID=3364014 RepID=UPI0036C34E27